MSSKSESGCGKLYGDPFRHCKLAIILFNIFFLLFFSAHWTCDIHETGFKQFSKMGKVWCNMVILLYILLIIFLNKSFYHLLN